MENTISRSLARSMYETLHRKLVNSGGLSWMDMNIYRPGRFASYLTPYRVNLSWWDHRDRKSSMMKRSADGKISFVDLKIPGSFNDEYERRVSNFSSFAMKSLFDEICRLSDEGYSLVYMKSELCRKKEVVEFIKPFEGSCLQVDADMCSPDYAFLDNSMEKIPFPF